MSRPLITLYLRDACHLCEEMIAEIVRHRSANDYDLRTADIDDDLTLLSRYDHKVPVLVLDGVEVCHFYLDEVALDDALVLWHQRREMEREENGSLREATRYERIYALIGQIPAGRVATYGQLAVLEGNSTARMVGYALAAIPGGLDLPWQRVINARGEISERSGGGGTQPQRNLLEREGVLFNRVGRVDFTHCRWAGPDPEWAERHGFSAPPSRD